MVEIAVNCDLEAPTVLMPLEFCSPEEDGSTCIMEVEDPRVKKALKEYEVMFTLPVWVALPVDIPLGPSEDLVLLKNLVVETPPPVGTSVLGPPV